MANEPAATTTTATTDADLTSPITPAAFLAELEAAGIKTTEETPGDGEGASGGDKPAATAEAKPEGDKPATETVEAKPEGEAAKPEAEAKPDPATETAAVESAEVKKARSIYNAAARKEAAALRTAQENKQLKAQLEHITKLVDENPLGLLQALGLGKGAEADPVKDLLSRIVKNGEKPAPTEAERIAALEKRLEDERTEAIARQERAVIAAAQQRVVDMVKGAGERFDLVNAMDEHDLVIATMEEHYAKHGVPIDPLKAAELVENHLSAKVAKATKFKPAGAAAPAAKPATTSTGNKPASDVKGKSETLTNTESGRTEPVDELPFDDHDARAREAAKALGLGFHRN